PFRNNGLPVGTLVAEDEPSSTGNPSSMIRDTSAQDRQIAVPRSRKKLFVWGGLAAAVLVAGTILVPVAARLMSSDSSASSARLRIAEVRRGDLVRDVSVQGRVVAA